MSRIDKAIIATAGYGTRRLPITKTIEKNMLPVGNRPIIDYVVEECVVAGISEIFLVVNDSERSQIRDYYGENLALGEFLRSRGAEEKLAKLATAPSGVRLHYVEQDVNDKYGTAVPVANVVKAFGVDEPTVFCNGDDFFWRAKGGSEVKTLIAGWKGGDESAMTGYQVPREEVVKYGMLRTDRQGYLTEVIEKPDLAEVTTNMVSINRGLFCPRFLRMCAEYVDGNDFGPMDQEYAITDVYRDYVASGGKIKIVRSTGEWMDCGSVEGWIYANEVVCRG